MHNLCGTKSTKIDTYSNLKKQAKGTGNGVHHIIEKRFAKSLKLGDTNQMGSVILTKSQHRVYTNAWRKALPYGKTYNAEQVLNAAKSVYKSAPDLLKYVTSILR